MEFVEPNDRLVAVVDVLAFPLKAPVNVVAEIDDIPEILDAKDIVIAPVGDDTSIWFAVPINEDTDPPT